MSDQNTADIGIAIYYLSTGLCVGAITTQGSIEGFVNEDTIMEAMPLSELGEVFDLENPARCIAHRGKPIGSFMGEPIPEYLRMSNGLRYEFEGTCPHPLDLTTLRPGQLMLLPGLLYTAPKHVPVPDVPTWSGTPMYRRSVNQPHPDDDVQAHPEETSQAHHE
jgi:hypothetical protein